MNAPDCSTIDLRQSAQAVSFTISPCRMEDADNVEICAPQQAEFWGVYYRMSDGYSLSLADFNTEAEALAFARHAASGCPVLLFDPIDGERSA